MIEAEHGEVAIEDLDRGMRIRTLDSGMQPIRCVSRTVIPGFGRMAPIRIQAGTFGATRDFWVSPMHRIHLSVGEIEMLFEDSEVLAAAKYLENGTQVRREKRVFVEYYHLMFDQHEIIESSGVWSECFHPGDVSVGSLCDDVRNELIELFPALRVDLAPNAEKPLTTPKSTAPRLIRPVYRGNNAAISGALPAPPQRKLLQKFTKLLINK